MMDLPRRRGPRRKNKEDLLNKIIHVTLTSRDYLDMLHASDGLEISIWVRGLIKEAIVKWKAETVETGES